LRRRQGGGVLCQCVGCRSGVVDVRGPGGRRADQQPHGATAPHRGAVAEERLRLSQRGRLPLRGTNPDGGANAAAATTASAGLLASSARGPTSSHDRPFATASWVNGYKNFSASAECGVRHYSRCSL